MTGLIWTTLWFFTGYAAAFITVEPLTHVLGMLAVGINDYVRSWCESLEKALDDNIKANRDIAAGYRKLTADRKKLVTCYEAVRREREALESIRDSLVAILKDERVTVNIDINSLEGTVKATRTVKSL